MINLQGKSRRILLEQMVDANGGVLEGPLEPPRIDVPLVELENRGTTQGTKPPSVAVSQELHQALLWSKQTIHKNTTAAKLRAAGRNDLAEGLEKCHTIFTVAQCQKCGTVQKFPNRCDRFYCAECQPRLSSDRKKAVAWWTREITQPKHVVLTVVNTLNITGDHKRELLKWFTNLRKRKFCRNWIGGFYSIEVTNEGRGWHLHIHALVNARYIDEMRLSEEWSSVTNGMGRIVKVRDARNLNYLSEVTKYAVKGSQLAAWTGAQIVEFIEAFTGARTFGVFGDLYGKRTQFAEWFAAVRDQKPPCKCGSCDMHYFTEAQFLEKDLVPETQQRSIPPPPPVDLLTLSLFPETSPMPPR